MLIHLVHSLTFICFPAAYQAIVPKFASLRLPDIATCGCINGVTLHSGPCDSVGLIGQHLVLRNLKGTYRLCRISAHPSSRCLIKIGYDNPASSWEEEYLILIAVPKKETDQSSYYACITYPIHYATVPSERWASLIQSRPRRARPLSTSINAMSYRDILRLRSHACHRSEGKQTHQSGIQIHGGV
ncbi:hypothetical protein DFS33DRAFT_218338 [Desarmillaria ectypa]|nr:hypothetical protein DFS33DRAFT_218338 [Desarmillaria ectypa]